MTLWAESRADGEDFVYDDIGNPKKYRGIDVTWQYGRELTSYNGNTFSYDARGRRISKQKTGETKITFTYDSNGNLIKQSNGLEFLYDHTGIFAVKYNGSTYFYKRNAKKSQGFYRKEKETSICFETKTK